ncbi:MAG: alpha-2-macroglobulin family protein [Chitinophagaceae bacterium]
MLLISKKISLIATGLLLFTCYLSAQQKMTNYTALWKKTDSLITKKGLTQSALEEVKKIYLLAKKEKQDAEMIKALVFQVSLQESTQENADASSIALLENEISSSSEPSASILSSILADKYLLYFQEQRYILYNRTNTINFTKADIATWGIEDFHTKIAALFLASLRNEKLLQQTKLDAYDPIVIKGNARYLRPTLYDLLAQRALDYFKDGERNVSNAAYTFEIKDPAYFSSAAAFSTLKINTKDSTSLHHQALLTWQKLIAFHLADEKPDALIDADISRIQFVQQNGVMEDKDKLYEKALRGIAEKYSTIAAAAQANYLVAQLYAGKAASYDPLKDDGSDSGSTKGAYLVAANICKLLIQQKEVSEGKTNAYNLLQQIERKELNLITEKVNLPSQAFRSLVSYRNFTQVYFRLVLMSENLKSKLNNRYDEKYWAELVALKPIRNWEQALPATNDYHKHHTEIKVDGLPTGQYILLASTNAGFTAEKNPLAVQYFYVSGISYINSSNEYFILNRESGQPLAGAKLQTWWTQYDYNSRSNKKVKGEQKIADKNGYLRIASKDARQQGTLQLEITTNNDKLFMDDGQYTYYREERSGKETMDAGQYEKENTQVFFFTDRSIYRPGQTVYFKGIAITKDFTSHKSKLYTGIPSIIQIRNANGETVDSLSLTTNEYGSYTGKFKLPEGLLNGEFTLIDDDLNGSTSFSVEEYKRPKFFVAYDTVKGSYKVNDSITITGFAKAYAGNNIDGAAVQYRVQRVARFIYPWLYWRGGYPHAADMEISNGTVTTGADGKFTIRFTAIPDLSVNKTLDPVFDYKITADVTDINGETRNGEITVPVAYKALQVNIGLADGSSIIADSLKGISVSTTNIAGNPEPAVVTITISKLQPPDDRLIRKRYWQQPDQFVMDKAVFIKNFPNDEYKDETDYRGWKKEKALFTKTGNSNTQSAFTIDARNSGNIFTDGWYAIEAVTKDKYGATVKDIKYVQLYTEKGKTLPTNAYTWSAQKNSTVEPGEQSVITIGSAAADVFLIQQVDKTKVAIHDAITTGEKDTATVYNFVQLTGKQNFSFTITEADRGGMGVYHFFVKDNRFYTLSNHINVPWTNKELQISYATFRDKTLPGSEEKWKLKISGYKKDKVAAEMLASMYDASLDQFKPHSWSIPGIWNNYYETSNWVGNYSFNQVQSQEKYWNEQQQYFEKTYDRLVSLQPRQSAGGRVMRSMAAAAPMQEESELADLTLSEKKLQGKVRGIQVQSDAALDTSNFEPAPKEPATASPANVQVRTNFNETAFFLPDLKTDSAGNIEFGFTIPEALTKWKFQAMAHTKDLAFGYSSNNVITQKSLMLQPNGPRFLREGDKLELTTKVVNLTEKELTGTVQLELINTATNQSVSGWFQNISPAQYFTAPANQSTLVKFSIAVPYQYNSAVSYRLIAKATLPPAGQGSHEAAEISDGEEAAMPVLTNSMLVTESMPLPIRGNAVKNFRFEKLLQSGASETLQQHALTVEFTTNPAWYAVQALPYLMEYPYDCAEQTFNRYYANAVATKIANTSPRLKAIFEQWKTADTAALLSNLQKNPELKAVLLEETPWVMEAKNETQQKKNIALLFDMMKMSKALSTSFEKLKQLQSENGGFVWFKGGADDRYMTQYITTGLGHLIKLGALNAAAKQDWASVAAKAVSYLDERIKEDYDNLVKHKTDLNKNNLGYLQVQYLYMRSFFDYAIPGKSFTAVNYYRKQSQQFWLQQSRYMQGMIALSLSRSGDAKTARDILKSLKQNAVVNEEMGMYWKENTAGYYWHQAPVETQSLLIEAFAEIGKDSKIVNDLKTWLLKQKQTQNWTTTKATAEACYALLLQGTDWLNNTPAVTIELGEKTIHSDSPEKGQEQAQAGTGYFKQTIDGPFVKPAMGAITVKIGSNANSSNTPPAWGAVYWQYFERLDKITPAVTPLKLNKQLFIEKNSDKGAVLTPIAENAYLKVGDKIKVRIELRVDRDMEYVHMKDMRASCMEPVNVLSGYKWQGGLGYYESTKDASTNFFFSWLPKGTYVFEYPLFVTHTGNFSNGVTSIQCMYAPEFASHSEGIRVNVE